jgi:tricorn protease
MKRILLGAGSVLAMIAGPLAAEEGYYQHPAASGDILVFASEGDLWRTGRDGGQLRQQQ